jgi:hypothetical protein
VEAVHTSETSIYFNEATRRYIPQGCHIHAFSCSVLSCSDVMLRGCWWSYFLNAHSVVDKYETPACCDNLLMGFFRSLHYAIRTALYLVPVDTRDLLYLVASKTELFALNLSVNCRTAFRKFLCYLFCCLTSIMADPSGRAV